VWPFPQDAHHQLDPIDVTIGGPTKATDSTASIRHPLRLELGLVASLRVFTH
jgi:hypothetical protein